MAADGVELLPLLSVSSGGVASGDPGGAALGPPNPDGVGPNALNAPDANVMANPSVRLPTAAEHSANGANTSGTSAANAASGALSSSPSPSPMSVPDRSNTLPGAPTVSAKDTPPPAGVKPPVPMPDLPEHRDLLLHTEAAWKAAGRAQTSWKMYARYAKHFLRWVESQGLRLATAPPDTLLRWLDAEVSENGQTRMVSTDALNNVFKAARAIGAVVPEFTAPARVPRVRGAGVRGAGRSRAAGNVGNANGNGNGVGEQVNGSTQRSTEMAMAGLPLQFPGAPSVGNATAPTVGNGAMAATPLAPPAPQPQPQTAPVFMIQAQPQRQPKAAPTATPPGRLRISLLSPGGLAGVAPGAPIHVGTYHTKDIRDGIENFIEKNVHPAQFGIARQAGAAILTYAVQRVDDRTNQPVGAIDEFSFAVALGGNDANAHRTSSLNAWSKQYEDEQMESLKRQNAELQAQIAALKGQPHDAMEYANLRQEANRIQADIRHVEQLTREREVREAKERAEEESRRERQDREARERIERAQLATPPLPAQPPPPAHDPFFPNAPGAAGLGNMFGPGLGGVPNNAGNGGNSSNLTEALVDVVRMAMEQRTAAAQAAPPPPPPMLPPHVPAIPEEVRDVLKVALAKLTEAPAPREMDPLIKMMLDNAREESKALREEIRDMRKEREAPKDRGFEAQLSTMKEIISFAKSLEPSSSPMGFMEMLSEVAPHADKLGEGLGRVLLGFRGAAPQLPGAVANGAGTTGANGASNGNANANGNGNGNAGAQEKTPLPPAARAALDKAASAQDDQTIVNAVFELLGILNAAPGWQDVLNGIGVRFNACDTKPEIRALVTAIFMVTGDKVLIGNEAATERVTSCLHRNYSTLFAYLNSGKTKSLLDGPGGQGAGVQSTPQAAPATPATTPLVTPTPSPAAPSTSPSTTPLSDADAGNVVEEDVPEDGDDEDAGEDEETS